jgi:hypothetical protein
MAEPSFGCGLSDLGFMDALMAENLPRSDVPRALREVWLAYHQSGWCQGLDCVFLFRPDGMEIWCAVEDERSYSRLTEMTRALQSAFKVEIYPTRRPKGKPEKEERMPPPSLWHNEELRSYLGASLGRKGPGALPPVETAEAETDMTLKQRVLGFAEQVLEWAERLRRYAADLPLLAWAAADAEAPADLKPQCADVCRKHARELGRNARRLQDNLAHAIPRAARTAKPARERRFQSEIGPPGRQAEQLAADAAEISRRVYGFVYPEEHTVELGDLREPGLLLALEDLGDAAAWFQSAILQSGRR